MSQLKSPLQILLRREGTATVKPFPVYFRQNFRQAFWRAAIFWWALWAILTAGVGIVAVISGDFIAALILLGIGMVSCGIHGAMASVLLTPLFLLVLDAGCP